MSLFDWEREEDEGPLWADVVFLVLCVIAVALMIYIGTR